MMGTDANNREDTFWKADFDIATGSLVNVIEEVKPHVMITYDEFGGYGHPDHIQAHRVAMAAAAWANCSTWNCTGNSERA
jgi:N-acetyl-1-D-myo-inositol-2-amino-2-deoxy-alpha-D-glucopyranoside deacetylase